MVQIQYTCRSPAGHQGRLYPRKECPGALLDKAVAMLLPGTRILIQRATSLCSNDSAALVSVGLLTVGASRSHSVILFRMSDRQKPHLTTQKIHKWLTPIPPVGIEPAIPANERLPGSTSCHYSNTNVI